MFWEDISWVVLLCKLWTELAVNRLSEEEKDHVCKNFIDTSGSVNLKVTTWQLLLSLNFLNFRLNWTELIFVEQPRTRTRRRWLRPFTKQDQKRTTPAETDPTYMGFKLWSRMFQMLRTIFSNLSITLIMSIFNILELSSNGGLAASRNFKREHSGIAYTTIRSRGKINILLFWTD